MGGVARWVPACYGLEVAGSSFIEHKGKRILRLDYTGLTPSEILAFMREAQQVIAAEPKRSVRLLSIAPRHVTSEVIGALKGFAAHNAPFVVASAIVGATSFQKAAIMLTISGQGRLDVEAFDDEEPAKEWLAAT